MEYYEDGASMMFPVGVAYVVEVIGKAAQLQFVFVADQWRGNGFGEELLTAIKWRWKRIMWTGAMDQMSERLLKSAGFYEVNDF